MKGRKRTSSHSEAFVVIVISSSLVLYLVFLCGFCGIVQGESICGNGILEDGEECDCGQERQCRDTCCRPLVCRLKEHAQCSNLEPCCKNCHFKRKWEPCRPAENECDVAEFCTGKGGSCPPNLFHQDGKNCSADSGYCSKGFCLNHDVQCKLLFKNVTSASEPCYDLLNRVGNDRGHCGHLEACEPENVMCGTLQCVARGSRSTSTASSEPQGCSPIGATAPLVQDRTKCGNGKVCHHQQCINMSTIFFTTPGQCPTDPSSKLVCSGHGDCTNRYTCQCHVGWRSEDCSEVDPPEPLDAVVSVPASRFPDESVPVVRDEPQGIISVTLTENGTGEDTNYTLGMIFAIAVVTISALFFMCALVYCYLFSGGSGGRGKGGGDSSTDGGVGGMGDEGGGDRGLTGVAARLSPLSPHIHKEANNHVSLEMSSITTATAPTGPEVLKSNGQVKCHAAPSSGAEPETELAHQLIDIGQCKSSPTKSDSNVSEEASSKDNESSSKDSQRTNGTKK